jgi:hypothetical protein
VFSSVIDAEKLFDVVDRYLSEEAQKEHKKERTLFNSFTYKARTE